MGKPAKDMGSRGNNILLAMGITALIVSLFVYLFSVYNRIAAFLGNTLGSLYLEDETAAKKFMFALFEEMKPENLEASKQAQGEFGFADNALEQIGTFMGLTVPPLMIPFALVLGIGMIGYALHGKRKSAAMERQRLLAEIQVLEERQKQREYQDENNKRIQNFIENVAHQIKTPISRVYTSLYLLEEGMREPCGKERLEECYGHLESVNMLMRRLMDIGKLEAGKIIFRKVRINFEELLEDTVRSCCGGEQRVNTVIETDENMEYYGDYEWLREAFMNIINNALEHNKIGKQVELACTQKGDNIKITVRDYGRGLREKDIPNIFDRFYLPEEAKSTHTGIGLNLAKLIIQGHFGSVYAYNHVDGGAVFNILLPLYPLKTGKSV